MAHKIPDINLEMTDEEKKLIKDVFGKEVDFNSIKLTDEELLDMDGEHYYKNNPLLETPVFFTEREEMLKKYKVNTKKTFDEKGRPPLPDPKSIFVKY